MLIKEFLIKNKDIIIYSVLGILILIMFILLIVLLRDR